MIVCLCKLSHSTSCEINHQLGPGWDESTLWSRLYDTSFTASNRKTCVNLKWEICSPLQPCHSMSHWPSCHVCRWWPNRGRKWTLPPWRSSSGCQYRNLYSSAWYKSLNHLYGCWWVIQNGGEWREKKQSKVILQQCDRVKRHDHQVRRWARERGVTTDFGS